MLALATLAQSLDQQTKRDSTSNTTPSVLLITLDTVRADHLACYGYSQIQTPAMDRLAADGIRFENAYAQVPNTLASHTVILTGTYPMFNGVRDFTSPTLAPNIPTLAEMLHRGGYQTAAFVSSLVLNSMWGLNRGFDLYDDDMRLDTNRERFLFLVQRRGDATTDRMLDWLNHRDGKPFFAWLHLYDAHSPYHSTETYRRRYPSHPYDAAIAFDDEQVGRVISRLRALNRYENTLIVLLSDHGESLGEHGEAEHGFFVYNVTLHVPLIVKLPGALGKSRVVSQPVATVDVAPTIAQVGGQPNSASYQGQSLLRQINNTRPERNDDVYAESYYPRDSFGWHELHALVGHEFAYIEAPRPELYDLLHDAGERSNVISTHSAVAATLRDQLSEYERKFAARGKSSAATPLDTETLEKLKSLGYVAYRANQTHNGADHNGAEAPDPKDKIKTLNRILRASDLSGEKKYAEADQLLGEIEGEEPGLYVVPFQKGENLLAWGKPQPALTEFNKALSRNPTFDQAALGLGRANFLLGQDAQAATAFELALHLNGHNFLATVALAKVHWRENLLEKAEAEFREVVNGHPEFGEAHADLGIILAQLRRYLEALPEIKRGIDLGFKEAIAYNYFGVGEAETGHLPEAMRAYEKAIEIDPHYAAAALNLALQYRNQGNPAKARAAFQKVCRLSDELCKQFAGQFPQGNSH
jgi:arylsulfatase A-like enzyme/Flp pilus assembly protein TadD